VPVIGVPAGLQPRAAVAYMLVAAVECAALAAAVPSLRTEIEAAARLLERLAAEWGPAAGDEVMPKRLARRLHGRMPVVYGAGATASVALRWKAQINENAKVPAFWSELPEADHNELVGWEGASGLAPLAAIFLDDAGAERALRRRLSLTASEIAAFEDPVEQIPSFGRSPLERVAAAVMLGDFVSLYLAALRGVDPTPVETIARFKRKLAEESRPVR
jgi:glucose/mannose-6-phosphate isomerase